MMHRLAGPLAADDEHVVLEGPDDELVDPDLGVLEVCGACHALRLPARETASTRPPRVGVGCHHARMTWYEAFPLVRRRAVRVELELEARNSDSFHTDDAAHINAARLAHLDTLGIDWTGKRVLDVGSGPGLLAEHLIAHAARR